MLTTTLSDYKASESKIWFKGTVGKKSQGKYHIDIVSRTSVYEEIIELK